MKYRTKRNTKYDFIGQSYGTNCFPNLHKYPATMIPQIGMEVLNDIRSPFSKMLDPYCGSGSSFARKQSYDVVLASPPYGDSKTTVAYGQFSMFSNSWAFNIDDARSLDKRMMGGIANKEVIKLESLIDTQIQQIASANIQRAKEISSFYVDLSHSISDVANTVVRGGFSIYVVGNRTVKGVNLATDQFIAEQFEKNNFRHIITYERIISNKRMPKLNSPSNITGNKSSTMNKEFIVISKR